MFLSYIGRESGWCLDCVAHGCEGASPARPVAFPHWAQKRSASSSWCPQLVQNMAQSPVHQKLRVLVGRCSQLLADGIENTVDEGDGLFAAEPARQFKCLVDH